MNKGKHVKRYASGSMAQANWLDFQNLSWIDNPPKGRKWIEKGRRRPPSDKVQYIGDDGKLHRVTRAEYDRLSAEAVSTAPIPAAVPEADYSFTERERILLQMAIVELVCAKVLPDVSAEEWQRLIAKVIVL